ncbi:MAG TPA: YecA family protein [Rhodanobacteraceae bacterium]|nr:YecA family protein [Rhodanobacteraceae bacterium]
MTTFTYEAVDAVLTRAKLGMSPDDLHGSVSGYLCAGGRGHAHELLMALALESEDAGAMGELHALLDEMAAGISRDLRTGEPITPLMPAGPLGLRADAMVDWCRGFLGGLALTGGFAQAAKAPEVRELLDDFSQIAAMHLACDGDDEAALDDVLDFIRGGVKQLHTALVPARRQ